MIDEYINQTNEAATFIKQRINRPDFKPQVALVLGSGLGKPAQLIKPIAEILYTDIPHFPRSTVVGHEGVLIVGHLEGVPVLGFKGRKHFYEVAREPNALDLVTFNVHVAANLDCKIYIATNAGGGLNPLFRAGDLMLIRSHVSFFFPNPLTGPHHDFGGNEYFQPLHTIYPQELRDKFKEINPAVHEGVYFAVTGRTYETQAEALFLRKLGADAVGMSTVPEMIVAHNRGLQTLGVSIITNTISGDGTNATSHEEVTKILNSSRIEEKLLTVFRKFFQKLYLK